MPLRDRLRRLQKAVRGDRDWLDLQDGSRYYFEPMEAHKALFLERMDVLRGFAVPDLSEGPHQPPREPPPAAPHVPAEIRAALAKATPESLRRFEEHYGPAEREHAVIHDDGRVTVRRIALDGSVETTLLEGEEARQYRE